MDSVFFNVTVQWIAIGILFFLLVYSCMQKPSEMQKHITVLTISSMLFVGGYLIRVNAENLQTGMLGATITYSGQPFVLLSAMMLISSFYGYHISPKRFAALSVLNAAVPVVVYTNPKHHLFYATVEFDINSAYSPMITTHGLVYNLNLALALGYFIAIVAIIITGYRRVKSPIKRVLSIYSILMVVSGVLGYVLYFLNLTNGYDSTMLGVALGAVFLSVMFFRCRIFDIVDKAKDYALDNTAEGLVVFDDSNTIIYENGIAQRMLEEDVPKSYIMELSGGEYRYDKDDKHFNIRVDTLERRGNILGKSVEIHDVSDTVNHRERLEYAVRETTENLETVQRTIFGSMASIVEARSLETGDHSKRVSHYTEMIARALREMGKHLDVLTDEYISTLVLSAPLHDIGKISIPDAILMKNESLNDEEFEVIKTHTVKGAEIIKTTMQGLESKAYITMATNNALYHHEWWNGKGYPEGLKGEEIPLSARIVAIADCYDAMTSRRCYKEAFAEEKALHIIIMERGSHFDPDVVDAFFLCNKLMEG